MTRIGLLLVSAAIVFGTAQTWAQESEILPTAAASNDAAGAAESVLSNTASPDNLPVEGQPVYDSGTSYSDAGSYGAGYYGDGGYSYGGYVGSQEYWNAAAWPNRGCGPHGCGPHGKGKPAGCYPRWYVEAEAIFLWRDNHSIFQPVAVNTITGAPELTTNSVDIDTGVGPRALIGVHLSERAALEVQYFSALGFSGSAAAFGDDDLSAPGDLGAFGFDWSFADQMDIDYSSEVHNIELNYLHTWGRWSFISGFRFLRLTEEYDLTTFNDFLAPTTTSFYNIDTRNDLYGIQLGGRYRHCIKRRFFWEATGKAGLFGNDARQSQLLTDFDDAVVLRDTETKSSPVAFVGDVNISVGYLLSRVWSVRAGYSAIWIDQVALGSDQLDFDLGPTAGTAINTSGSVFMHGVNVGIEGRW